MANLSHKKKIHQRQVTCQRKLDINKLDLNRLKILKQYKNFNQLKNPQNLKNLIRILNHIHKKSHRAKHKNTNVKRFNKHKSCLKPNILLSGNKNNINNKNNRSNHNNLGNPRLDEIDLFNFNVDYIKPNKKLSLAKLKKLKILCKQIIEYEYRKPQLLSLLKYIKKDSVVPIKYCLNAVPDELSLPYSIGKESMPLNIYKSLIDDKKDSKLRVLAYKILKQLLIKKRLEVLKDRLGKADNKKLNLTRYFNHPSTIIKRYIVESQSELPKLHLKYMIISK